MRDFRPLPCINWLQRSRSLHTSSGRRVVCYAVSMDLKAADGNCFTIGQFGGRRVVVVVFPDRDLLLSCYQCRLKCNQGSRLVVVHFLGPGAALLCYSPWELLHWRPQQDRRKLQCPGTSTLLSSLLSSASLREERSSIHMASPSLANVTIVAKRTFGVTSQPPHFTYIVSPQQAAYSYFFGAYSYFFGVKKALFLKDRIPDAMRQRYLGLFIEECLKFSFSRREAIKKAQSEEKEVYDQSPTKSKYLNAALLTLKKLRGLVPSAVPGLNKATLYSRLLSYQLTEMDLNDNGFPYAHPDEPGSAMLFSPQPPLSPTHRTCCRCNTEYLVSSSGCCLCPDPCVYHWGRTRTIRVFGVSQTWYTCCFEPIGATGCTVAPQHVQDGRKDNLQGFVKTFPKLDWEAHAGIYALDCEMSYTTHGLELTRVTVVDMDLRVIYDTFVKPDNEIVDYNTRFSGVTEADLANTNVRLRDVQAKLLSLFSSETILIGHSLENDLLALKFIHSTVVDTSLLFPHHLGLPYKRSLRSLVSEYLDQKIQTSEGGHDSIEDARACMQLVTCKIQEDAMTSSFPEQ